MQAVGHTRTAAHRTCSHGASRQLGLNIIAPLSRWPTMSAPVASRTPRWFVAGDINGFFGLVVDNLSILGFIAMALVGIFGFPAEVVFGRMFPGTALGVLVGNLMYTVMARRLAQRSGRDDVTAMPLGLDAPTSIGMALLVLGPAFVGFKAAGMDEAAAAMATWQLGMASLVVMGLLKLVLSFAGDAVTAHVPRAALLGAIGGAALMLLGFLPLIESLRQPLVGLVTLGVLLYVLVAGGRVPLRLPGVLFALLIGVALYYGLGSAGLLTGFALPAGFALAPSLPLPSLGFVSGLAYTVPYLSLLLPFGLLMVVGGINVAESARAAGDDYRTRDVLLVEAVSTLIAGVCGGVAQTTPYIGQPAYKRLGARSGYTLLTGLFIGIGGMLGLVSGLVQWLPVAVLAPIIVFVGLDITVQAFNSTRREHALAVALAFLPAIAYLINIKFGSWVAPDAAAGLYAAIDSHGMSDVAALQVLGNGFIITAMLWAAALIALIERRTAMAVSVLLLAAALTLFGVIHSTDPRGGVYLPWAISGLRQSISLQLAGAYGLLALGALATLWPSAKAADDHAH
jgi:AGZA family xanthine/uracil permease-like MFS transporter